MKKITLFLLLLSTYIQAQYSIKGHLNPPKKHSWMLLYKLEGVKQTYLQNTKINATNKTIAGAETTVGYFEFQLPADTKKGVYRITYDIDNGGFVDILFNKENIELTINPDAPQIGVNIIQSKENEVYQNYMREIAARQYKTDSTQIAYIKNKQQNSKAGYSASLKKLNEIQNRYLKKSEGMFAYHFIKASKRYNSNTIVETYDEYISNALSHFFDHIDLNDKNLRNSSFLSDRISDYVFYMNFATTPKEQDINYKKAVDLILSEVKDIAFKADIIEFLISQFTVLKNAVLVDYLFKKHFDSLPEKHQNLEFKNKTLAEMAAAVGRIAPDFSWEENGKTIKLSEVSGSSNYLLIFYSTECPHCLREVPQVFDFLKNNSKVKVVAFAMEEEASTWKNYKNTLPGWHHALGLGKWKNEVARTYQINATPTYFVLDANKKITSIPETLNDLKAVLKQLN